MSGLRPAHTTDAGSIGEILHRFQQETDWMPELYTGAEYIAFAGAMIDMGWVTVAEVDGRVQGFMARDGEEICALYVSPEVNQRGIGRRLLNEAKRRSRRLRLKAFAANDWAHRFYARQGFVEQGRGDGSDNDANLPDIAFVWVGAPTTPDDGDPSGAGAPAGDDADDGDSKGDSDGKEIKP